MSVPVLGDGPLASPRGRFSPTARAVGRTLLTNGRRTHESRVALGTRRSGSDFTERTFANDEHTPRSTEASRELHALEFACEPLRYAQPADSHPLSSEGSRCVARPLSSSEPSSCSAELQRKQRHCEWPSVNKGFLPGTARKSRFESELHGTSRSMAHAPADCQGTLHARSQA